MNARINKLVDRAKNPRDKNFRQHLYIFLICCGISLFIWFLIKMTDDYVAEVRIPLNYTNIPEDQLLNNTGDKISVKLRGNGSDLFSVKYISSGGRINVNLAQAELKISRFFDRYYFLTENLYPEVSERFDFNHTLISISPDTIFLDIEDIIARSLPVKSMINVSCKEQYMLYGNIVCTPESIMVSGPASVVDTLKYIETQSRDLAGLDKTEEIVVPIVVPVKDKKIRYSENEISLLIPVEKYTESTIEIPLIGKSTDSGITTIRTFPETVQLTYQVAIKDYQMVKAEMFSLTAEYDPQRDKEKTFLKVHVDKSPDFVRITRTQPEKVEFIIQN